MHHYPHHLGDYAKDTVGLTQGQHGAHRLLMDASYATESGIPVEEVYSIAKATNAAERRNADRVLAKFWVLRDGRYHQKRVDAEIAIYRAKSAKATASANRRWGKADAPADMPTHMRSHSEGTANGVLASSQQPVANNQQQQQSGKRLSVNDWRPEPSDLDAAASTRPDLVDLDAILVKFRDFYSEKRISKAPRTWAKAWHEWLANEHAPNKGNGAHREPRDDNGRAAAAARHDKTRTMIALQRDSAERAVEMPARLKDFLK